jgi:rubrerythrin
VRYLVGIVLTLVGGHYAIGALQRYLERQKTAEALSEAERRQDISYEVAHERLNKGICPGCERPVDLKDGARNFCMHCGIGLFRPCPACGVRANAFARFCHACGADMTMTEKPHAA